MRLALTPSGLRLAATRAVAFTREAQETLAPFGIRSDYLRRAGLATLVIDLLALVSIWRSRGHSLKAKLVWTALVAVLPVVGAAAWFVLGRERRGTGTRAG
jgi:hypothetical protein